MLRVAIIKRIKHFKHIACYNIYYYYRQIRI